MLCSANKAPDVRGLILIDLPLMCPFDDLFRRKTCIVQGRNRVYGVMEKLQLVDEDGVPTTVPGTHILEAGLDGPQIQVRDRAVRAAAIPSQVVHGGDKRSEGIYEESTNNTSLLSC
jgi:hypothetical protein